MTNRPLFTDDELLALREQCWPAVERRLVCRTRTRGLLRHAVFGLSLILLGILLSFATPYPHTPYGPLSLEFRGIPF